MLRVNVSPRVGLLLGCLMVAVGLALMAFMFWRIAVYDGLHVGVLNREGAFYNEPWLLLVGFLGGMLVGAGWVVARGPRAS